MLPSYEDIIDRAGEPDWYDSKGTPRYGDFEPHKVTVHGHSVSLYLIECQACGKEMKVSHVWRDPVELIRLRPKHGGFDMDVYETKEEMDDAWQALMNKLHDPDTSKFRFGDPPSHGACSGDSMSSIPKRCLEHYKRGKKPWRDWERVPEKEVEVDLSW